jgi:hypothetical protein
MPKESLEHSSSTMSTVDEKISNLQSAVASLTASVATLTAEVAHLSGKSFPPQTMKTSIPLLPMRQSTTRTFNRAPEAGRRPYREMQNRATQPQAAQTQSRASHQDAPSAQAPRMIALSDILAADEDVTFYVNTGNDSNGNLTQTTAVASFDGTDLVVSTCDLIPSLVGLQTQKPGEILYKFIEELKNANHIKRTFSVAPWKLCYVVRDGQQQTLDELRKVFTSQ